jgi:hypothetical protein
VVFIPLFVTGIQDDQKAESNHLSTVAQLVTKYGSMQ